ncbi:MAG: GGDEF domain-containing phosphodiesterase [Miltoncostaeaceae bacterium]
MLSAVALLVQRSVLTDAAGAGFAVAMTCALAGLGAVTARSAARRAQGVERRVWILVGLGLLSWALGVVPYLAFLAVDGDVRSPAAYSQIGFLLAYPFWYRALWLIRGPVIGATPLRRAETWLTEAAVFVLLGSIAASLLWHDELGAVENMAQFIPLGLDLLLLHSVYTAVRRSSITHRTAVVWLAYGFAALAITDAAVSSLVVGAPAPVLSLALIGYAVAMCFITIGATRPLRITEAQVMLGRSAALLAALGVALAGVSATVAPAQLRPVAWAVGAVLFVRLWVLLGRQGRTETDELTGFLELRAFTRHLAGVAQLAAADRPAALVAIELERFEAWAARHGTAARDMLLTGMARRLDSSELQDGAWGRIGPDRLAWVGRVESPIHARQLTEAALSAMSDNVAGMEGCATFVMIPDDAPTEADAVSAANEGLTAASTSRRRVVAFDRGYLDGLDHAGGYTATLARRRQAVLDIFRTPNALSTLLQPIVDLSDGTVMGFEALSRVSLSPERAPDRWVAEARAVGLGDDVEVAFVRHAMHRRGGLPPGTRLSLNVSPATVLLPEMEEALGSAPLDGIIIEITENEAVHDYARLAARLATYRGRGALIAIDDTGAGHSSMRHIAQLAPDYIKIDRSLIHDLHLDHAKRALVRSMVSLERDLGAQLIAEGIEQPDELATLRELGVHYGQGYLLGRPAAEPTSVPSAVTAV